MTEETKALVEKAKALVKKNGGDIDFTIPDNCPGDGWDGRLTEKGCYMNCDSHFEGEFFDWEEEELQDALEEIIEACEKTLSDTTYAVLRLYRTDNGFGCEVKTKDSSLTIENMTQRNVLIQAHRKLVSMLGTDDNEWGMTEPQKRTWLSDYINRHGCTLDVTDCHVVVNGTLITHLTTINDFFEAPVHVWAGGLPETSDECAEIMGEDAMEAISKLQPLVAEGGGKEIIRQL